MLRAATRNIAVAYGKGNDLGTLEPGKIADMVILDRDPLQSSENYRTIHQVVKDGAVVNREALPGKAVLTAPPQAQSPEERAYLAHRHIGRSALPMCPLCMFN